MCSNRYWPLFSRRAITQDHIHINNTYSIIFLLVRSDTLSWDSLEHWRRIQVSIFYCFFLDSLDYQCWIFIFMNAHSLHLFWLRKSNYNQIRFLDIVILLDDSYIHVMCIWYYNSVSSTYGGLSTIDMRVLVVYCCCFFCFCFFFV